MRAPFWMTTAFTLAATAAGLDAQEVQVPADAGGRIEVITPELARRLGLFADVTGFREARLFRLPDSSFVLEITSTPNGTLTRERRPMSAAQTAEFRRDLTARIAARAPGKLVDQSGRLKLLIGSTVLGLGYYGWATAAAVDPDDDQTAVALYMITAAGSFFLPFVATRVIAIPDAVASMALWGAMRGPIHGLVASELGDADRDKTKFAWSVALGATEAIAGGVAARSLNMTSGRAELTGAGGDIGLGVGYLAANLFKWDKRYTTRTVTYPGQAPYTFQVTDRTLQSAAILAGSGLGLAGGYVLGRSGDWTRGDAYVFRNMTVMGALAGLAVGDIIQQPRLVTVTDSLGTVAYAYYQDELAPTHSAAGLIGAAAGALVGRRLVAGRNFNTMQGTLLTLSPLAGGLFGLGLAYVVTPHKDYVYYPNAATPVTDPNDHSELYLSAAALGATAGFAALYPSMARDARGQTVGSRFHFSLNPLAVAQFRAGQRSPVPLGAVSWEF